MAKTKLRPKSSGAQKKKDLPKPPTPAENADMKMLLKDFKDIVEHAKVKGESELADKLQLKYNELENIVTGKSASASENGDTNDRGVELVDNYIKLKQEGTSTTVLSKWRKLSPSDFPPVTGPVSQYTETIMEIDDENLNEAMKQLSNINRFKLKQQVGSKLTPNQVDKVSSEANVTDEILTTILKTKYSGLRYQQYCNQFLPYVQRKKGAGAVQLKCFPYTGRVEPLLKHQKSRTRKLYRLLSDIRFLKKDFRDGKELWPVQMDKLNREDDILQEIADQYSGLQFI